MHKQLKDICYRSWFPVCTCKDCERTIDLKSLVKDIFERVYLPSKTRYIMVTKTGKTSLVSRQAIEIQATLGNVKSVRPIEQSKVYCLDLGRYGQGVDSDTYHCEDKVIADTVCSYHLR